MSDSGPIAPPTNEGEGEAEDVGGDEGEGEGEGELMVPGVMMEEANRRRRRKKILEREASLNRQNHPPQIETPARNQVHSASNPEDGVALSAMLVRRHPCLCGRYQRAGASG